MVPTEFFIRDHLNINTVKRALALPDQRPEVEKGDELVVAFPKTFIEENFTRKLGNTWSAPDRRHIGGKVSFIPYNFVNDYFLVQEMIWDHGITLSKVQGVDKRRTLAKLVIFLCLKSKGGSDFLLIPRPDKRILPDVFTLGFMKSLTLSSLEAPFRNAITANRLLAASPKALSAANLFGHISLKLDDLPLCGDNGLFPYLPFVRKEDIVNSGIIAGGKDISLVYLIEYALPLLERIAYEAGGMLIDICDYTYEDVTCYYNQGKDGWSEAILKYILSRI